jgi:hypothetical protein
MKAQEVPPPASHSALAASLTHCSAPAPEAAAEQAALEEAAALDQAAGDDAAPPMGQAPGAEATVGDEGPKEALVMEFDFGGGKKKVAPPRGWDPRS